MLTTNDITTVSPMQASRSTIDILLNELLVLEKSTVDLMEISTGLKLQVMVESQTEEKIIEKYFIKRIARLFFSSSDAACIYCVTYLNKSLLTNVEYQNIMKGSQPIGRLFTLLNKNVFISKRNISVTIGESRQIAEKLQSMDNSYYKKKYDYWIGRRKIGEVIEYFNKESLSRG